MEKKRKRKQIIEIPRAAVCFILLYTSLDVFCSTSAAASLSVSASVILIEVSRVFQTPSMNPAA